MGGRQIPVYCEHGVCVDGGDFAETESCQQCRHSHEIITPQQARIEALEAEVERRKEAFENQWHLHYEMQRNAWGRVQELESAARGLLSAIEAYQYAQAPAEPLPWLAPQANALAALLDSEPSAHTCNASCQLPACVLRRRVEALEAEVQAYRDIRSDSTGVAGYYPNGDSALWDEFDIPEQEGGE